jgi:hypothetical protein
MSLIRVNPVGVYRASVADFSQTKNPSYYLAKLTFARGDSESLPDFEPKERLLMNKAVAANFSSTCAVGQTYDFLLSATLSKNKLDGSYGISYRFVGVV